MRGFWRSYGNRKEGEAGSEGVGELVVKRETRSGWARVGLSEMSGERSSEVRTGGEVRLGIRGRRN